MAAGAVVYVGVEIDSSQGAANVAGILLMVAGILGFLRALMAWRRATLHEVSRSGRPSEAPERI